MSWRSSSTSDSSRSTTQCRSSTRIWRWQGVEVGCGRDYDGFGGRRPRPAPWHRLVALDTSGTGRRPALQPRKITSQPRRSVAPSPSTSGRDLRLLAAPHDLPGRACPRARTGAIGTSRWSRTGRRRKCRACIRGPRSTGCCLKVSTDIAGLRAWLSMQVRDRARTRGRSSQRCQRWQSRCPYRCDGLPMARGGVEHRHSASAASSTYVKSRKCFPSPKR